MTTINSRNDTQAFLGALTDASTPIGRRAAEIFNSGKEIIVARAPGRLDVMGGIADYSGSLVLQWPIREATFAAAQTANNGRLTIVSVGNSERAHTAILPVAHLSGSPGDYTSLRAYYQAAKEHWAAYVAGAVAVLARERGLDVRGLRILISSDVPEGKGVSSSAALEVATMQAVAAAYGVAMEARDTALFCQKAENLVVGAPCGVMDQMTSAAGRSDRFLALRCQPAELLGYVDLPPELALWGIDSGIRHAVSGADYGSVRTAAFMGLKILEAAAGEIASDWNGYLANIAPSELIQNYERHLPEQMAGAEFVAAYGGVDDPISVVHPDRSYAVRAATAHPIWENFRVTAFGELLTRGYTEGAGRLLGELMYQSHAGYSACGLGSDGTDRLVEMARSAGPDSNIYGAKITGGGSGGTVAILGRKDARESVLALAAAYGMESGTTPHIFEGSSDGAEGSPLIAPLPRAQQ